MKENDISGAIVDACMNIHKRLGPGLFETVYERVLDYEIRNRGLKVSRQVNISIKYDDLKIDEGFRADLIVEGRVIVELKSLEHVARVHYKQLLTYLRLTGLRLGLLVNFGALLMKDGIFRVVNQLEE